jgi:heptosyltransferase-3
VKLKLPINRLFTENAPVLADLGDVRDNYEAIDIPFRRASSDSINRIIILRHGAIGDVVVETPALEAIRNRFPSAHITLLCEPYSAPILEGLPYYDAMVVARDRPGARLIYYRQLLQLRKSKFDLLIAMRGTGRFRMQAVFIGGKIRLGHASTRLGMSMFNRIGRVEPGRHRVQHAVEFLRPLGIEPRSDEMHLRVAVSDQYRAEARQLLLENGIKRPYVVIHATFSGRPANETWSDHNFVRVAEGLHQMGFDIVMTSGTSEAKVVERIQSICKIPIFTAAGKTHPRALAAVLERAELYFGYNTGAMHIAAAVGIPIVAIFERPSKLPEWRPWTDSPFKVLIPEASETESGGEAQYVANHIRPWQVMEVIETILKESERYPRNVALSSKLPLHSGLRNFG